jgi:hypothetical protein
MESWSDAKLGLPSWLSTFTPSLPFQRFVGLFGENLLLGPFLALPP